MKKVYRLVNMYIILEDVFNLENNWHRCTFWMSLLITVHRVQLCVYKRKVNCACMGSYFGTVMLLCIHFGHLRDRCTRIFVQRYEIYY